MSYFAAQSLHTIAVRAKSLGVALSAAVLTTACAGSGGLGEQNLALLSSDDKAAAKDARPTGAHELMKATDYWRKEFTKKPKDKKVALSYARNLKAMGQKKQALGVLQHAANFHSRDREIASEYGRLAVDLDQISVAKRLLSVADDPTKPDWRVISARGTVLAKEGQYGAALGLYQRALELSPGEPSVMNNLALAHMMNGDSKSAESLLRQAVSKGGPHTRKTKQNLALALGVQGKYNESTSIAASALPKAHASANANYLKKLVKLAPADVPVARPAVTTAPKRSKPKLPAKPKAPLTPEQIIARATAATLSKDYSGAAGKPSAKAVKKVAAKKTKAKVVRTVAKASDAKAAKLPFKPSSF